MQRKARNPSLSNILSLHLLKLIRSHGSPYCTLFYLGDDPRTQSSSNDSSGAKNVTTGLEDSGVEVGQESEQESTSGRAVKPAADVGNSVHNVPAEKQKQVVPGQVNRSNTEHIEFGGKSIIEEHGNETRKSKAASG